VEGPLITQWSESGGRNRERDICSEISLLTLRLRNNDWGSVGDSIERTAQADVAITIIGFEHRSVGRALNCNVAGPVTVSKATRVGWNTGEGLKRGGRTTQSNIGREVGYDAIQWVLRREADCELLADVLR